MVRPNVPGPPTGNSETRYRATYDERELGVWRDPEHSAARFLIDNGLAERGDMLRTFRGDVLCMTGSVGWFADRMTLETEKDRARSNGGRFPPDRSWQDGRRARTRRHIPFGGRRAYLTHCLPTSSPACAPIGRERSARATR
jgi:hypothetical protein